MSKHPENRDVWHLPADGIRIGCTYTGRRFNGTDDVAAHFGLFRLGPKWISISRHEALAILEHLLRRQLAHRSERLSSVDASTVASRFIDRFAEDAKFATNCRWLEQPRYDPDLKALFPPDAEAATSATFDGGVVALSEVFCGVFWIEDED